MVFWLNIGKRTPISQKQPTTKPQHLPPFPKWPQHVMSTPFFPIPKNPSGNQRLKECIHRCIKQNPTQNPVGWGCSWTSGNGMLNSRRLSKAKVIIRSYKTRTRIHLYNLYVVHIPWNPNDPLFGLAFFELYMQFIILQPELASGFRLLNT